MALSKEIFDYYHVDNIEDTPDEERSSFFYHPKSIIPANVDLEFIQSSLTDENTIFFRTIPNEHMFSSVRKLLIQSWSPNYLRLSWWFIIRNKLLLAKIMRSNTSRSYLMLDKKTVDLFSGKEEEIMRLGIPSEVGEEGYFVSLLINWGGKVERISKHDLLFPNKNLGAPGTGTSLLCRAFMCLPESQLSKLPFGFLRRSISDL